MNFDCPNTVCMYRMRTNSVCSNNWHVVYFQAVKINFIKKYVAQIRRKYFQHVFFDIKIDSKNVPL